MTSKFKKFEEEVADLCRSELQTDIDDLSSLDVSTMKDYWRSGQSPEDFFQEQIASTGGKPLDAYTDEEFNPRFEL